MFIDIHNHLLPGVDDGVDSIEETIKELKKYRENNILYTIFTPHINNPSVETDIEKIKKTYNNLKDMIEKETGTKTFLASELYLTPNYKEFIPFNDIFCLIEFPTQTFPVYALDSIFNLQLDGYEIILAHVERYKWLYENKDLAHRMKEMNVYFQVNLEGLTSEEAKYYLKNNMVEFLATDNHGSSNRSEVDLSLFDKYSNITTKALGILGIKD